MTTNNLFLRNKLKKFENKLGSRNDEDEIKQLFETILDKSRHLPAVQKYLDKQQKKEQRQSDERSWCKTTTKTR
jgi:ATP-dependent Lon protease